MKYRKKVTDRFHNIQYYESNEYNIRNKEFLDKEKQRLVTLKTKRVSQIINEKRSSNDAEKVFEILKNIYEKNKKIAFDSEDINIETNNADLFNLVTSVPLLMISYAKIKKNTGIMTPAFKMSNEEYNRLNPDQMNLINKLDKGVDGISIEIFQETSRLLKLGQYPWGTSRRIYLEKPGKPGKKKRPLTIPLFMDKIIQEAIKIVLVSIYEPYFDKMNCSFGFRPNRAPQDAINTLTNQLAQGLDKALEGDIEGAYNKVVRTKLIILLSKKIKDRKFLNLIKDRLNYEFYDTEKRLYVKEEEGIQQGGTDSPYLWNIYMLEFDIFIMKDIMEIITKINIKTRGDNINERIVNNERVQLSNLKCTITKIVNWIRSSGQNYTIKDKLLKLQDTSLTKWKDIDPTLSGNNKGGIKSILKDIQIKNESEINIIKILQKKTKNLIHKMNNVPFANINKKKLRLIYCRFADDWIILTNVKTEVLLVIKQRISSFLKEELSATLSDEKTLITNIKEKPAHFLGFEIKTYRNNKIVKYESIIKGKKKKITAKVAGSKVFALIDKKRILERSHMKGYCNSRGFPREIAKLNNLEAFTIIDRFNSVLIGFINYYINFIRSPKTELSRWVYIYRYSCLKTLALKHKTSIKGILEKYKPEKYNEKETVTIEDTVVMNLEGKKFYKTWRLHTIQSLMTLCRSKKAMLRRTEIQDRFWNLHKNIPLDYSEKLKNIVISHDDYLDRINWVNIRTKASFDLPCSLCGSDENIEMHYIKHVRKNKYSDIDKQKTWEQVMVLRNRKQIPVCRNCHMNIIHKGSYGGSALHTMSIEKMFNNRIINIENYIHKGDLNINYNKSLSEKGWKVDRDKGITTQ